MNWAIYQSFARIPLGLAVTIEFVGPLTWRCSAPAGPGTWSGWGWPALGVVLLGLRAAASSTSAGVAFALLAGAAWAAYILLSAQTGRRWPGLDGLARRQRGRHRAAHARWPSARAAAACSTRGCCCSAPLVGLLSSVIPYSCELVALRTLRPAVFSILMSLEPAAAALAGHRRAPGVPQPACSGWPMACVVVGERRRDPHAARCIAEPRAGLSPAFTCRRSSRERHTRLTRGSTRPGSSRSSPYRSPRWDPEAADVRRRPVIERLAGRFPADGPTQRDDRFAPPSRSGGRS